jgi:hypothetical protein
MKLLLSPRFSEDSVALSGAAVEAGWEVVRLQAWRTPPIDDVGAIYGETLWARAIAGQVRKMLLEPPLDWLTRLPEEFLRRRVRHGTLAELGSIELPAFIKPEDDKTFEAGVYSALYGFIPPTGRVLVSDVVKFVDEYRVWCLDGAAMITDPYRGPGVDLSAARDFAVEALYVASEFTPRAAVIDVGRLDTGEWAVVETNPAFSSGIYHALPEPILAVVAAACVDEAPAQFSQPVELK